ncbi:MAG: hypothetical protein AAB619_01720, partial [Patescibacteria group bacterium]
VNNDFGGTKGPGDFMINVKQSGTDIPGSPFAGVGGDGQLFPLPTGEYTISEDTLPPGYALQSIDCQEDDVWSLDRASFATQLPTSETVEIGEGEEITCTVTNRDIQPRLTVTKEVINNNGGAKQISDFPLFVGLTSVTSGVQNGFNAGVYTVSEGSHDGYTSTIGVDCALNGSITLNPGDVKSCLITNDDQQATLTVIKHVINDNGGIKTAGDFTMTIDGVTVVGGATFAGAENPGVTREVVPGVYNITETQLAGYAASFSADCAGSIALGENKTCTITNNDIVSSIGLIKTAAPTVVAAGGNITYTLAWSVSGSNPVTNAVVSDTLPANTSFVSAACGTTTGTCIINSATSTITWSLGTRNAGESGTVTLVVKTASPIANGTVITNTGTFDTTETPPVTSIANTPVTSAPSLSITKTNDVVGFTNPGKSVTYTVTVTNAVGATDTAKNVVITDTLPAGFTFADTGLATKTTAAGDLAPGVSKVFTFLVNISGTQATGVYANTAAAKGDNTTTVTATSNVDVRVPAVLGVTSEPMLAITKTVDVKVTNPGKNVTYTVTLNNPGDTDVTNVSLTDTLPTGFTFVDSGKTTKTWSIGTLKAHHQRVINYLVKIGDGVKAGKYENAALVLSNELDPQTAKATVEVKVPQVLGLATTGVSLRDYIVFALGLGSMILGLYWAGRQRRTYGANPV